MLQKTYCESRRKNINSFLRGDVVVVAVVVAFACVASVPVPVRAERNIQKDARKMGRQQKGREMGREQKRSRSRTSRTKYRAARRKRGKWVNNKTLRIATPSNVKLDHFQIRAYNTQQCCAEMLRSFGRSFTQPQACLK